MRKSKPTSSPTDDVIDTVLIAGAGILLLGLFGGLFIAYGWKSLLTNTPL